MEKDKDCELSEDMLKNVTGGTLAEKIKEYDEKQKKQGETDTDQSNIMRGLSTLTGNKK